MGILNLGFGDLMIEMIPQKCIDFLPLSAEPIVSWRSKSDIKSFLCELYNAVDFPSYGDYLFTTGRAKWKKL